MPGLQKPSFPASYDPLTKGISAAVVAGYVLLLVTTKSTLIGAAGFSVLALAYLYSPRSYQIAEGALLIRRWIGTVRLPLASIRELRSGSADDFRKCIRLWGSGGLFGYYGLFRTAKLGKCWWYMTNRKNSVIVVSQQRTAVLSPDDVAAFLAAVRSEVPVPETTTLEPSLKQREKPASVFPWSASIAGAFAILIAGILCFAMLYSPGLPRLTLTPRSLKIHDHFYPLTLNAADIDVNGIRVVNIRTDPEWTPTIRTNGFANAHYHSGWFRASGRPFRMYWANGAKLVLLPPLKSAGVPVLVQVEHPEQFAQQLRREWATH